MLLVVMSAFAGLIVSMGLAMLGVYSVWMQLGLAIVASYPMWHLLKTERKDHV